jgi:hypothetical protein
MVSSKTKKDIEQALKTWPGCNDFLRAATEKEAELMLKIEQENKRRVQYLLRIYSRFNSMRAKRERATLFEIKK